MALTTEERRQLRELAGEFAHDNPRLARAMAGRWYARRAPARTSQRPRRKRRFGVVWDWLALVLTAAGFVLLVAGAALDLPVLIAIGAVALVDGPAVFAGRRMWQSLWP